MTLWRADAGRGQNGSGYRESDHPRAPTKPVSALSIKKGPLINSRHRDHRGIQYMVAVPSVARTVNRGDYEDEVAQDKRIDAPREKNRVL